MPASPPSPAPTDRQGAHILECLRRTLGDRYEIECEIGRGGMAVVYRARDLRHDRQVAIKVLPPELATAIAAERFILEIRTAAQLLHPHILGLIDSGDAEGLPYYIMPHVQGESLREKLMRERRLALPEAARIVREVASALAHAHHHGVVHRDVKPENVLLVEGTHAVVADFGLALALLRSTDRKLTRSSHVVGTVTYMSPEQANSSEGVDGRADIYSLGCMLFEMLAGRPPYEGHSPYAVLAQHMSARPPRLAGRGSNVPVAVERLVHRALEKAPARRHQNAEELSAELDAAVGSGSGPWYARALPFARTYRGARNRHVAIAASVVGTAAVAAIVAVSPVAQPVRDVISGALGTPLDTTRVAVFELRRARGLPAEVAPGLLLHDAFARWRGITLVDQLSLSDRVRRLGKPDPDGDDLGEIATEFRAGRFVHGEVTPVGDSLRISASLYDTRSGEPLENEVLSVSRTGSAAEPYERIAEQLLFRGAPAAGHEAGARGTTSVPARQAYTRGRQALNEWDVARADQALLEATTHDPDYAAANFWLAQLRSWTSENAEQWRPLAERAAAGAAQLGVKEQALAAALRDMARGDFPAACARYAEVKRAGPGDFAATFGSGECIRRDSIVIRDARSPSGWRFRGSRHAASLAYLEAFELLPSAHKAFPATAFGRVRAFLMTSTSARVYGRAAAPDTTPFKAAPSWEGDTLLLVPWSQEDERQRPERVVSRTTVAAVDHQRALFRQIAAGWRKAFPEDVAPLEAMAVALELTGNAAALDTLLLARRRATDEATRMRLAAQEVWLRVKFALPDDQRSLVVARTLADSLLTAASRAPAAAMPLGTRNALAGLAVLTGRVHLAATLAAGAASPSEGVSSRTAARAAALLAYAAAGAPADSIRVLESRIVDDVRGSVAGDARSTVTRRLLSQAAGLAYPVQPFASHDVLAGTGNPFLDAQWQHARGQRDRARATLRNEEAGRALRRPADLTLDITYPAAALLVALGDRDDALAWIDPVLSSVQMQAPEVISRVANAGGLVRALALRAEIASAMGDVPGTRRWAGAVALLWAGADPPLHRVRQRMQVLASRPITAQAPRR